MKLSGGALVGLDAYLSAALLSPKIVKYMV